MKIFRAEEAVPEEEEGDCGGATRAARRRESTRAQGRVASGGRKLAWTFPELPLRGTDRAARGRLAPNPPDRSADF